VVSVNGSVKGKVGIIIGFVMSIIPFDLKAYKVIFYI